jgi:hypothetical protein
MKTRSSAGVGQKVDLAFDIAGLRITDLPEDEQGSTAFQPSAMLDKIKRNTNVTHQEKTIAEESIIEDTDATDRLRSMLKKVNK